MRKLLAILVLALVPITSCFEIGQDITLKKDLSGTLTFTMTMNMEAFIDIMASMQAMMPTKKKGKQLSADEMKAKMRQELMKKGLGGQKPDFKGFQKDLPPGITPKSIKVERRDLKISYKVKLAFDHIRRLNKLNLKTKSLQGGGSSRGGTIDPTSKFYNLSKPFEGIVIKEEGKHLTITITAKTQKKKGAKKKPNMGGGMMAAQMEAHMKDMGVHFSITVPFKVVEHNADKLEGNKLTWKYGFARMQKMEEKQEALILKVKMLKE